MDKVEFLILKCLLNDEEYTRKVLPFIKEEYFEDGEKNGDYNPNVTVMAPLENGMGIRSTSMGDQMLLGNTKYKVAFCGFEEI